MKEATIEKRFVKRVEEQGWVTRKYKTANSRGVPDRIVFPGLGLTSFVELKATGGKLSVLQKREIELMGKYKVYISVIDSYEMVEEYIKHTKSQLEIGREILKKHGGFV